MTIASCYCSLQSDLGQDEVAFILRPHPHPCCTRFGGEGKLEVAFRFWKRP
jgi:hypothetical protein